MNVVDRLANLGIIATNRTLSAMEHGQGVDVGPLPELAVALDYTLTDLLGLTQEPERWAPDSASATAAPSAAADFGTAPGRAPAIHPVSWTLGPDVPERRPTERQARRA